MELSKEVRERLDNFKDSQGLTTDEEALNRLFDVVNAWDRVYKEVKLLDRRLFLRYESVLGNKEE